MFLKLLFLVGLASVIAENYNNNEEEPTSIIGAFFRHKAGLTENSNAEVNSGDNDLYNSDYTNNNVDYDIKRLVRKARDTNMPLSTETATANIFPMKCPKNKVRVGWKCILKNSH